MSDQTKIKRTPLPSTLEEGYQYARRNNRIVPWAPYGNSHIDLTCLNHPKLFWTTKNIRYIGARSIFQKTLGEKECDCSVDDLIVVVPENWQEKVIPLNILKCHCCQVEIMEETYSMVSHCSNCFDSKCYYHKNSCQVDKKVDTKV